MGSFSSDQAEGLRRMLAGPRPRVYTFLSAVSVGEKSAMLVNLGASLARRGSHVMLLDACEAPYGIACRMGLQNHATLQDVACQQRALDEAVHAAPQGFGLASLAAGSLHDIARDAGAARRLSNTLNVLAAQNDILVVDAEIEQDQAFALPALLGGEIVVQVSPDADSIKRAYSMIKRLNAELGRRPFSLLVTGAAEREAGLVFQNIAYAASRYLAVQLDSIGSVPVDDHVKRAARAGRSVVDAFPLARASVAFRGLAQKFVLPRVATIGA